eukprot:5668880-Amphidinium_carterae.1
MKRGAMIRKHHGSQRNVGSAETHERTGTVRCFLTCVPEVEKVVWGATWRWNAKACILNAGTVHIRLC